MNLIACCDAVSVGIPYEFVRLRPSLSASEENFLLVLDDSLRDTIAAFREPFWRKKNMNKNKNCSFLFKKFHLLVQIWSRIFFRLCSNLIDSTISNHLKKNVEKNLQSKALLQKSEVMLRQSLRHHAMAIEYLKWKAWNFRPLWINESIPVKYHELMAHRFLPHKLLLGIPTYLEV